MANDISDKMHVLVEEAKKVKYSNGILFAEGIAKKKLEEFSYFRNNKIQYCDINTIREYISFAKDLGIITDELSAPPGLTYRSKVGFETWLGDKVLEYLDQNDVSIDKQKSEATKLINNKILPTTEKLYESLKSDVSIKHFRWSLTILQVVRPLLLGVCRKWVWVPGGLFKY